MTIELLRRVLGVLVGSSATDAHYETRLSKLEARQDELEDHVTQSLDEVNTGISNLKSRVDEWTGVRGYSHGSD